MYRAEFVVERYDEHHMVDVYAGKHICHGLRVFVLRFRIEQRLK